MLLTGGAKMTSLVVALLCSEDTDGVAFAAGVLPGVAATEVFVPLMNTMSPEYKTLFCRTKRGSSSKPSTLLLVCNVISNRKEMHVTQRMSFRSC